MTDEEFEKTKKEYSEFKKELKVLFEKYSVKKVESEQYNGNEEYAGIEIYLSLNGNCLYSETIGEILDEITL